MCSSNQCRINQFLGKFAHKIPTESAILYQLFCGKVSAENFREILAESDDFSTNPSLKIPQNLTFFFHDLSEAL